MTISISVSVGGDHKVPITVKYGEHEQEPVVISGRGREVPFIYDIPYYHGTNPSKVVTVVVGPEEQDNG